MTGKRRNRVQVMLDDEEFEKLQQAARAESKTDSTFARDALRKVLGLD